MINSIVKKGLPWFLIVFSVLLLGKLPAIVCGGGIVIGITMLLNRIWPEKWGQADDVVKE